MQGGRIQVTLSTTLFGEHTNFESLIVSCLSLSDKYPQLLRSALVNGNVTSVCIRPDMMFEHPSENPDRGILLQPKYPTYTLPYRHSYPNMIDIAYPIATILCCQDFNDLFEVWQIEVCSLLRSLALRWFCVQSTGEDPPLSDLGPSARRFIMSHKHYMREATPSNSWNASNSGSCPTCGRT